MKKVNMSSIANKIKFIYGDECEKNTVGIVIFYNGTDYFFDEKFNNKMSNEEVEALLLRGAVIFKDGKYFKPASFDDENVSFGSEVVIDPDDIDVDLSDYATKEYVDERLQNVNDCIRLVRTANLLDDSSLIPNKKFTSTGDIITNEAYSTYEQYIEIDQSKNTIYFGSLIKNTTDIVLLSTTGTDVCLYDNDKKHIIRLMAVNTIKISDYPNARFLRFNVASNVVAARKIGVFYDELPTEWVEYGQYYILTDNIRNEQINMHIIDCWGDSLTNGVGANGNGYPNKLAALLGDEYIVNKYGNGGENATGIAARQGGYDIYLKPFILSGSSKVEITLYNNDDDRIKITNIWGINPCYINDVQCTFSMTDGKYYIQQNGTEQIAFDRPVKLNTLGSIVSKRHINIIWAGTNNTAEDSINVIINSIQSMVDNLEHDKYIVVGLTAKCVHSNIEEKNKQLWARFGKRFLDIRKYILDYGLSDLGIEPTDDDVSTITNGEMPPSILSDDIHFKEIGYELIANLIYKKGQELGYWQ